MPGARLVVARRRRKGARFRAGGRNYVTRRDVMRKLLLGAAIFAGAIGISTAQADTGGAVAGAGNGLLGARAPGARWWAASLGRSGASRSGDLRSAKVIAGPTAISTGTAATPKTGKAH